MSLLVSLSDYCIVVIIIITIAANEQEEELSFNEYQTSVAVVSNPCFVYNWGKNAPYIYLPTCIHTYSLEQRSTLILLSRMLPWQPSNPSLPSMSSCCPGHSSLRESSQLYSLNPCC